MKFTNLMQSFPPMPFGRKSEPPCCFFDECRNDAWESKTAASKTLPLS
jgi:hypothetical protein